MLTSEDENEKSEDRGKREEREPNARRSMKSANIILYSNANCCRAEELSLDAELLMTAEYGALRVSRILRVGSEIAEKCSAQMNAERKELALDESVEEYS